MSNLAIIQKTMLHLGIKIQMRQFKEILDNLEEKNMQNRCMNVHLLGFFTKIYLESRKKYFEMSFLSGLSVTLSHFSH